MIWFAAAILSIGWPQVSMHSTDKSQSCTWRACRRVPKKCRRLDADCFFCSASEDSTVHLRRVVAADTSRYAVSRRCQSHEN
jgi:hypothetical protein